MYYYVAAYAVPVVSLLYAILCAMLVDAVPLTLEEIFIYELGGADYAVKDIVL